MKKEKIIVSFCEKCGAKLIDVEGENFNGQTGKRATYKACPTGTCGHTGIWHKWRPEKERKGIRRFFPLLPAYEFCEKCHEREGSPPSKWFPLNLLFKGKLKFSSYFKFN